MPAPNRRPRNGPRPPVLSRIGSPALGAWSAARKLRSAYAGSLIRVRRSTDDAEANIGTVRRDGADVLDTAALLAHVGSAYVPVTGGLVLTGVANNFAKSSSAHAITGDVEVIVKQVPGAASSPWQASGTWLLCGNRSGADTGFSFIMVAGVFYFQPTIGGALRSVSTSISAPNLVTLNAAAYVKMIGRPNVSGDRFVSISTSSDGTNWTLLASNTGAGNGGTIGTATLMFAVGAQSGSSTSDLCPWTVQRFTLNDGINGTTVLDVDFTRAPRDNTTSTFVADTGQVVTINRAGASAFVTKLYDQVGSADAVQATSANQPRIVNAGVIDAYGGRPCVRYRAAGTENHRLTTSVAVADTTFSVMAVGALESGAPAYARLLGLGVSGQDDVAPTQFYMVRHNANQAMAVGSDTDYTSVTGSVTYSSLFVASAVMNGTTAAARVNGTYLATSPKARSTTFAISFLSIGANCLSVSNANWQGGIPEVIVFPDALPDVDRLAIERDMGAFYGVTVQ